MHTITFWAHMKAAASAEVIFCWIQQIEPALSIREDSFGLEFRRWAASLGSSSTLLCDLEKVTTSLEPVSSYLI